MSASRLSSFLFAASALAVAAGVLTIVPPALAVAGPAQPVALPATPGALVALSVTVDGQAAPLYYAPDGSGRFYLEARKGCRYAVTLENRSGERVGAVLAVDGLNVVSGARDAGRGRMYVLDPWQRTTVQGWRTSLEEVRRFRFVDEAASYAARSDKANEKMGWIELAVYRERRPFVRTGPIPELPELPASQPVPQDRAKGAGRAEAAPAGNDAAPARDARAQSFPGTGWGERTRDEVRLVEFDPESAASDRVTLRYEYRPALVALGVLPPAHRWHDRLHERDRAEAGFVAPPAW